MRRCASGLAVAIWLLLHLGGCSDSSSWAIEPPRQAPEIEGTDWNGAAFALSALRGEVSVLTFGYTQCPDICPTTLARLKQAVGGREEVAVVFLTVDPQRDTKDRLAAYVPAFDERFHAPTLTAEAQERMLAAYEVVATRRYAPARSFDQPARYAIDHTSGFLVVDRKGRLRLRLPAEASPEEIRKEIARLAAEEA